jgi:hypothetical protein
MFPLRKSRRSVFPFATSLSPCAILQGRKAKQVCVKLLDHGHSAVHVGIQRASVCVNRRRNACSCFNFHSECKRALIIVWHSFRSKFEHVINSSRNPFHLSKSDPFQRFCASEYFIILLTMYEFSGCCRRRNTPLVELCTSCDDGATAEKS